MQGKRIVRRLLFLLPATCKAIVKAVNNSARDLELRNRYLNAIIDDGCCMSDNVVLGQKTHILSGTIINNSQVGDYTYIGRNSLVQNTHIGNYCSISQECIIGLGNHPLNRFSTSPLFYHKKNTFNIQIVDDKTDFKDYRSISIGNDVWIGARVVILDGIKVETGAVLAAGCVVTKDVPPYAVVAGVPARIIKYRTSEDKIVQYMSTEWWKMSPDDAYKVMKNL